MTDTQAATAIVAFMRTKNYRIDMTTGHMNIIYLEGMNPDWVLNLDAPDGWNDLSIILAFDSGGDPSIVFSAACTTEPGKAATFGSEARRLGGVARIAFGQHTAWKVGFHRQSRLLNMHPALIQCAPIPVHRDSNRDGKRTGDPMGWAFGLNQHGTSGSYTGGPIGKWSAGCLVRQWWNDHLEFMRIVKTDIRYQADRNFIFSSTIIAGDQLIKTIAELAKTL